MKIHKALIVLFAIPVIVTACDTKEPCEVRPTHTRVNILTGAEECVEADGELCDDDPCDTDDDEFKPKTPAAKPKTTKRR